MQQKTKDRVGDKFGKMKILSLHKISVASGRSYVVADCVCDCGKEKSVRLENLINKAGTKSCGCLQREINVARSTKHGDCKRGEISREYHIWSQMISRCTNPNNQGWESYGGRGISVCDRWRDYRNFIADMGPAIEKDHTIERQDVNGNYEPTNCIWLKRRLQGKNTRRVKRIVFRGETMIQQDWAIRFKVGVGVLTRLVEKHGEQKAMELLAE